MTTTIAALDKHFAARPNMGLCDPKCGPSCGPSCNPQCWPTGTGPWTPNGGCQPNYD
jgi:hypothetical protein